MDMKINRRELIGGATAATFLGVLPPSISIAATDQDTISLTRAFLQTLGEDAGAARFEFGGDTHRFWNFMGTRVKPGLPLEDMSGGQKDAAAAMLRNVLSTAGYEKMRLVMETQDVMREMGRAPSSRNSERFSMAVFGEPAPDSVWGLRIEGHHLSLNWTLRGNEIVAVTPSSFSVIPQMIPIGDRKGTAVLKAEEFLARRLINDLQGAKKRTALVSERPSSNVQALAGRESRFTAKSGIPVADLTTAQGDLLWELIETTAVAPWPGGIAESQRLRIREGDQAAVHFAWEGGLERGNMFYYRIHGDTFVLELASVFGDPEHLHATFNDPDRTFGRHIL